MCISYANVAKSSKGKNDNVEVNFVLHCFRLNCVFDFMAGLLDPVLQNYYFKATEATIMKL